MLIETGQNKSENLIKVLGAGARDSSKGSNPVKLPIPGKSIGKLKEKKKSSGVAGLPVRKFVPLVLDDDSKSPVPTIMDTSRSPSNNNIFVRSIMLQSRNIGDPS